MKILRRCLIALAYLLVLVVLLAGVLYAWLVIANWNDDPISAVAQRALQYTPPTEQELQNNGYLVIMGFDAPDTGDPVQEAIALGRQRLARAIERRRWVEQHGLQEDGMPQAISQYAASSGDAILMPALRCPVTEPDCFGFYLARRAAIESALQAQQTSLKRYAAAGSAGQFNNPAPFYLDTEFPPFAALIRTQELLLAQGALQWEAGEAEQAMLTFEQSAQVRSHLAAKADSLLASMIALAMHYRELRWLSNAVTHIRTDTPPEIISQISGALGSPPPTLDKALEGEKKFAASAHFSNQNLPADFIALPGEKQPWWQPLTNKLLGVAFLPQQTINIAVDDLQRVQAISALPTEQIQHAFKAYAQERKNDSTCNSLWRYARNASGRCISAALPLLEPYVLRIADVDGYRRLVGLQLQAVRAKITASDMPEWLNNSQATLHNPYTLQPMQWDAANNSLVFEGRTRQPQNPDASSTYRVRLFHTQP